ncbi:hypothetical protein A4A49_26889 [Nicotiana attenuata]|uniref:Uncharacterized protein n=1 Tax=Nicotiana attenuata TaxID=49451 RepID=A0A1J6KN92_NICAT|nr:hypothetical protein A4A49_26889 [Nicotiana attenuata]
MGRATKAKRAGARKLKWYAELKQKLASLRDSSSSSSKGKGKGKAKAKASSCNASERTSKEMEEIEVWVMGQKKIAVESELEIDALLEISRKHGR